MSGKMKTKVTEAAALAVQCVLYVSRDALHLFCCITSFLYV